METERAVSSRMRLSRFFSAPPPASTVAGDSNAHFGTRYFFTSRFRNRASLQEMSGFAQTSGKRSGFAT